MCNSLLLANLEFVVYTDVFIWIYMFTFIGIHYNTRVYLVVAYWDVLACTCVCI